MDDKYECHIEHQFDVYCIKVIKNASIDLARRDSKRVRNEFFLEDIRFSDREMDFRSDDEESGKIFYKLKNRFITKEMLSQAINRLSDESSSVINLYYYEDFNDAQIGKTLNISRRLTTYKRNSALKKLKEYLEEENEKEKTE